MYTFELTGSPFMFVLSQLVAYVTPPCTSASNNVVTYSPAELKTTRLMRPSSARRHSISTG